MISEGRDPTSTGMAARLLDCSSNFRRDENPFCMFRTISGSAVSIQISKRNHLFLKGDLCLMPDLYSPAISSIKLPLGPCGESLANLNLRKRAKNYITEARRWNCLTLTKQAKYIPWESQDVEATQKSSFHWAKE